MEGLVKTFFSLVFTNFIPQDLPTPLIVRSKIDCAKGCVLDPYCQSFLYVKVALCYHIPELLANTSGLITQDGVGYYQVHKVCPDTNGYIYHATVNVCYKIHLHESQTWTDSRHICQQEGGDLITLENSAKDEFIRNAILDIIGTTDVDFFIGGKQTATLGSWEWIDGTSITNFTKKPKVKHCLEIDGNIWDADRCYPRRQPFVCEIKV